MASHTPVSLPLTSTLPPIGSTILPPSIASSLPLPASGNNTTKILLLSNFSPDLKTRDIQHLFGEWEDVGGGFKIKWNDDVSCWIVFNDPGVAKRAFLTLLSSPPPSLLPTPTHTPTLTPYNGPETLTILSAVSNRPRSRSVTNSSHSRKGSSLGSGGRGSRGSFGQKQLKELIDLEGEREKAPEVPRIPVEHREGGSPGEGEGEGNGL